MIFFQGFLLGLMLQLSVGPVFFAVLHKSISQGFQEALKMTCAVALVDAFYISISFTAVSALLKISYMHKLINIFGMAVLIYFGLTYIKKETHISGQMTEHKRGDISSFIYGLKLTLINPLTIVFWSGTFGSLMAGNKLAGTFNIILYSMGCVSATIVFLGLTSFLGKSIKKYLDVKILRLMDYVVGIILICFGIIVFLGNR